MIMLVAFIAAVCFAVGHDQFYRRLDGRPAPTGNLTFSKMSISKQQANLIGGNAFTLLVKVCMALAASIAFTQIFWMVANAASRDDGVLLGRADAMTSSLRDLIAFPNPLVWAASPTLQMVALIAW
jgi:hypothetical protein